MANLKSVLSTIFFFVLLFNHQSVHAQEVEPKVNMEEISVTIDSINNKLQTNYVFPEIANKMAQNLIQNLKKGKYNSLVNPSEFAGQLTDDLQSVSNDKHIRVRFDQRGIAAQNEAVTTEDSLRLLHNYVDNMKRRNFGFKEVKILEGNIGYLDLRSFSNVEYAGETAVSAMRFLSNTDAMIIDLRFNGGGSPEMIQLITSYLYDSDPVHLNNFYWRPSNQHTQTWTLPHVPGKRSPETAVYILTSRSTFSAAEEFCYNLKNLNRATLIGETTGGGAHPGGTVNATDRYTIWIPTGRAINPITNTNWEGTGVSPHIEVVSSQALAIAHIKALETLKEQNKNEDIGQLYSWPLAELKVKSNPVRIEESILKSYVGTYGPRVINFENKTLFYQRGSNTKYELIPMNQSEFMLKGLSYFRIKFVSENNEVVALVGMYDNGNSDKNLKQKK